MDIEKENKKEVLKEALKELCAIVLAKFAVFPTDDAVLAGLGQAFDLGYAMGHAEGRSDALTLAEAIMSEFLVVKKAQES